MNAHALSKLSTVESGNETLKFENPSDAECLISAAELLLPNLEVGKTIDAPLLRSSMEDAFGASDTEGAWIWKDAYEAVEIAQVKMLIRYGAAMKRQAGSANHFLEMIQKLSALAPTHTRRSEDSQKLQQFSTPLPLSVIAAEAANIQSTDVILEPSAGTGMLAIFGQITGAKLTLNELAETRRGILAGLFPNASLSSHDVASIDDRLGRSIQPTIILMNPPFSAAPNVDGRFKQATSQHVLSALARLAPGGRLVLISGASFNPFTKSFKSTFARIAETSTIVFSSRVAGKLFAKHGTTIETRLTVIDKRNNDDPGSSINPEAYLSICETAEELLGALKLHCPDRTNDHASANTSKTSVLSIRDAARKETKALSAERAKHPFDNAETIQLDYLPKSWSDPSGSMTDAVYEEYQLQAFTVEDATPHPTALVQSARWHQLHLPCRNIWTCHGIVPCP